MIEHEPNKYKKPVRELAKEWHISTASVSRYAARGCPWWTESDKEIASWMKRKLHKKSPKLRAKLEEFFPRPVPAVEATTEIDESCDDDDIEIRDDLTSDERVKMIEGLLKWNDLNHSINELCEPLIKGDMESARQLGRLEKEVEILRAELEQYFISGIWVAPTSNQFLSE